MRLNARAVGNNGHYQTLVRTGAVAMAAWRSACYLVDAPHMFARRRVALMGRRQ